jgi:hypothetical protein
MHAFRFIPQILEEQEKAKAATKADADKANGKKEK